MIHRLKCWKRARGTGRELFRDVLTGAKRFEVRKDDRGFEEGDQIDLVEVDDLFPEKETGRVVRLNVTYVLRAEEIPGYPLADGWVILGLSR